ncbi:MAG: Cell division protein FtsL [Firmicutes bacterium ADurb.Bin182]|nr:MAG: Cell division protein FtsL [Firmicutes bacterium ADurb.Bin182]
MSIRRHSIRPKFILLLTAVIIAALAFVVKNQQIKLQEIKTEQAQLTRELNELKIEEQRMQRMIEFAKTEKYLIRYAREKLGYVMPGDILFETGE